MPYPLIDESFSPYGPVATFLTKGIQPPAAQYIGPADQLQLNVLSPNVSSSFNLGLRFLDLHGNISPLLTNVVVPATGATPSVETITPGECFLLSAVITGANVRRGQCWVTLNLQRGNPTGGAAVGMVLIAGYATQTDTIGFPQSIAQDSLSGRGAGLIYVGSVPAVNAFPTVTVPPATRWLVAYAFAQLNAPATSANSTYLHINGPGGKTRLEFSVPGSLPSDPAGNSHLAFPTGAGLFGGSQLLVEPGDVITLQNYQGLAAGSQFSALSVSVEEFVEL